MSGSDDDGTSLCMFGIICALINMGVCAWLGLHWGLILSSSLVVFLVGIIAMARGLEIARKRRGQS